MKKIKSYLFAITPFLAPGAFSAPPTSGAYVTDPQSEYTADQATREVSNPSQILCFISNTRLDAMVNGGTYVALIDGVKCDNEGMTDSSQSAASGSTGAVSYSSVSATSTRASSSSPQISKGHVDLKEGDMRLPVYFHMTQSEAASESAPNGVLTFNYALALGDSMTVNGMTLPAGSMLVRGRISASAMDILYAEKGGIGTGQTNDVRLYVTNAGSSGSGAVEADYNGTSEDASYVFGFNATHFCRSGSEGGSSVAQRCFKRSKADAIKSVWRYGVYNADGSRYDLPSPGFSVRDASGEWGFASYGGIWFRNPPADGATVTHAKTGVSYTVRKASGKLLKITRSFKTLDEIKNNKFQFFNQTAGNGLSQNKNYEAYWDAATERFEVVGVKDCTSDGCFTSSISLAISLTASQLLSSNPGGVWGWSQSLGSLSIPATTLSAGSPGSLDNGVRYLKETVVKPGDTVPSNLKCVADCPTANLLYAFANNPSSASPFQPNSANLSARSQGLLNPIAYTWDSATYALKDATNTSVGAGQLANINVVDLGKTNFKWGIRSGALVDASRFVPGGAMDCDGAGGASNYCDWKSSEVDEFYRFETGIEDWNRATFLMQGSSVVSFSPPMDAVYQVPSEAKYGKYAGALMNLQFGGFGNLHGIPGRCVNPITNGAADCSPNTRWLPAFDIADGTTITINGSTKFVKWLERELRFAPDSGTASSLGIIMGNYTNLPAKITTTSCSDIADIENPCNSSSGNYPGAFSYELFKKTPAVIHGVVQ